MGIARFPVTGVFYRLPFQEPFLLRLLLNRIKSLYKSEETP